MQAHWAFIAIRLLRHARGLVFPLVIFFFSRGEGGALSNLIFFGIATTFAAGALVLSFVQWWFYRYRLTGRDISLRSGVFSKQERVVPFERIQSVDLEEAPLERLMHVVRVRVETAAGGQKDADIQIQALRRNEAIALRSHLLAARQQARVARRAQQDGSEPANDRAVPSAPPASAVGGVSGDELIRHLSIRDLLLTGATSGRVGPALALVGAASQFADDLVPRSWWDRVPWDGFVHAASDVRIIAGAVLVFGLIAWLLAILTTVLTFGGFELRRDGDQLSLQYGLLDRRRVTIPMRRIQAISVVETMLRQPFRLAEIRFETAGFGTDTGSNGVLFPMLPRSDVLDVLRAACPEFVMDIDPGAMKRLPSRARARYVVAASIGWVLTVSIASVAVVRFTVIPWWWLGSLFLVTPAFAWFGNLRYRDAGWIIDGDQFLLRWRAMSRVTLLTRVQRIQFRLLTADPFQRRASLVTFSAAVASGSPGSRFTLSHLDSREAEQLAWQLGTRVNREPPRAIAPLAAADSGTA